MKTRTALQTLRDRAQAERAAKNPRGVHVFPAEPTRARVDDADAYARRVLRTYAASGPDGARERQAEVDRERAIADTSDRPRDLNEALKRANETPLPTKAREPAYRWPAWTCPDCDRHNPVDTFDTCRQCNKHVLHGLETWSDQSLVDWYEECWLQQGKQRSGAYELIELVRRLAAEGESERTRKAVEAERERLRAAARSARGVRPDADLNAESMRDLLIGVYGLSRDEWLESHEEMLISLLEALESKP